MQMQLKARSIPFVILATLAPFALAQPEPATAPTTAPIAPSLEALSRETRALFEEVRPGVVRVQLPPTYWPAQQSGASDPLEKWKSRLDPAVRQKLEEVQAQARAAAAANPNAPHDAELRAEITPTTQPAGAHPATQPTNDTTLFAVPIPAGSTPRLAVTPRPDGGVELLPFSSGSVPYDAEVPTNLTLRVIGLLLDDNGHVLVPLYIEPAAVGDESMRVTSAAGGMTTAKFVGSDRQTNLTVLKLESPIGRPVHLTGSRPTDGSLVMVLSPAGDSGKLGVWTGGQQDRGIVVAMDGSVAGFARYGQFLSGAFAKPVVDQLIQFGRVRRATLGVLVEETETPDGGRGMRIDRVAADSPAGKVGLKPGDFILSMAGAPVGDLPSFAAAIAARDGQTELQILRDEKTFTVTVVLHPQ
jgi:hypothetical protein